MRFFTKILSVYEFKVRLITSNVLSIICLFLILKVEREYLKLYLDKLHHLELVAGYYTAMYIRIGIMTIYIAGCIISSLYVTSTGGNYMDYTVTGLMRAAFALMFSISISFECYSYKHAMLNILFLNVAASSELLFTNMYNVITIYPECEWLYLMNTDPLTCLACKKQIENHYYKCSSKSCNFVVHLSCSIDIKKCPNCKGTFNVTSLV